MIDRVIFLGEGVPIHHAYSEIFQNREQYISSNYARVFMNGTLREVKWVLSVDKDIRNLPPFIFPLKILSAMSCNLVSIRIKLNTEGITSRKEYMYVTSPFFSPKSQSKLVCKIIFGRDQHGNSK